MSRAGAQGEQFPHIQPQKLSTNQGWWFTDVKAALYVLVMSHLNQRWFSSLIKALTKGHPDSKVHGANMGPIWGRQDPGGPQVGPMNFALWVVMGESHVAMKETWKIMHTAIDKSHLRLYVESSLILPEISSLS